MINGSRQLVRSSGDAHTLDMQQLVSEAFPQGSELNCDIKMRTISMIHRSFCTSSYLTLLNNSSALRVIDVESISIAVASADVFATAVYYIMPIRSQTKSRARRKKEERDGRYLQ
jgi:hypothetical protein